MSGVILRTVLGHINCNWLNKITKRSQHLFEIWALSSCLLRSFSCIQQIPFNLSITFVYTASRLTSWPWHVDMNFRFVRAGFEGWPLEWLQAHKASSYWLPLLRLVRVLRQEFFLNKMHFCFMEESFFGGEGNIPFVKNVLLIERDDWLKATTNMSCYSCDTPPQKKGGVAVDLNVLFDILVDQNGGRKFWQVSSHREIAWSGLVMVSCAFRDWLGRSMILKLLIFGVFSGWFY